MADSDGPDKKQQAQSLLNTSKSDQKKEYVYKFFPSFKDLVVAKKSKVPRPSDFACIYCKGTSLKSKTGYANLWKHVVQKHAKQVVQSMQNAEPGQGTMTPFLVPKHKEVDVGNDRTADNACCKD